ncbi:hypothetical protein VDG1235_184 [Verrucomicrobiia bacterium DG1235]|nr:hypothetical protein VDG1235_184 [Verrucomicrobiae bacterium DG1235]
MPLGRSKGFVFDGEILCKSKSDNGVGDIFLANCFAGIVLP